MSAAAKTPARSARALDLKDKARVVAWGLGFYAAVYFAGGFFASQRTAAAGVQAALTEWATGTLGIAWSDPHAPPPTLAANAKRALKGAAGALGTVALLAALALGTHAAHAAGGGLSPIALLLTLILPALLAVRDEIMLHGLVLRVLSTAPRAAQLAACGASSMAAALGGSESGLTPAQLAVAGLTGIAFGALWQRDRGAWMAWGAHAAWLWGTGTLGSLLDVGTSGWAGGDAGLAGGGVAVVATLIAAIAASIWSFRTASAPPPPAPPPAPPVAPAPS